MLALKNWTLVSSPHNLLLESIVWVPRRKGSFMPKRLPRNRSAARNFSAVPAGARIMAPDLCRGIMLLSICMGNVTTAWLAMNPGTVPAATIGGIVNNSLWDRIAIIFSTIFVHVRGLPMFTFLLGYGLGLLATALYRRGYSIPKMKRVLIRRYALLSCFGIFHMIFLYFGDIMTFLGVAGVLMTLIMQWKDRHLLYLAGGLFMFSPAVEIIGDRKSVV